MSLHGKQIKIFAGNSNLTLATEIGEKIGLPLGKSTVGRFSDGECEINIGEVVRGCDVFLLQSTCPPVNENIMELLIMIDALKRASASRITAVIPYFGYARQDRKAKSRDPISAKLMANLLTKAGADRILTMDLHANQIQGFFDIPLDHLEGIPYIAKYFKRKFKGSDDTVVVAPDVGSVDRARKLAQNLSLPIAIIDKRRARANVCEVMNVVGDVKDKNCILIDDLIDTAGTIVNAAKALKKLGAKKIYTACTHPLFSGKAIERLKNSEIEEIVVLNTIPLTKEKQIDKIKVISVATIFSEAIERIYGDISLSTLFKDN